MKLKEIPVIGTPSWCPVSEKTNLLAVGSIAGALDADFSSKAHLEIYELNYASGSEVNVVGRIDSNDRFNRLAWGNLSSLPMGLLAGAMNNGAITCWNPAKIINKEEKDAVVARLQKHTGPVRGLDFNPFSANLLASGGEDGAINVWNLQNPSSPSFSTITESNPSSVGNVISHLQWNKHAPKILAACSYNGVTSIWDAKDKKSLLQFVVKNPESSQSLRCSALAWNPSMSTQLVVASEDDRWPTLQLWDLRKAYAPIKELRGHSNGILSVAWCPDDDNFLLSCGKDNRTIVWNPNTGEIQAELPSSSSWMFDVQWSHSPSIVSTASFDSKISIYAVQDFSDDQSQGNQIADTGDFAQQIGLGNGQPVVVKKTVFKTAPKWLKRPVGASFGFGGKLVSFVNTNDARRVTVHSVVTDEEFVQKAQKFEQVLQQGDYKSFCEEKSATASKQEDKTAWDMLKLLLEENPRQQLLNYFGFDEQSIATEIQQKTADDEDVSNTSPSSPQDSESKAFRQSARKHRDGEEIDILIRKALMVGNFEQAVNCCLYAGRMDEALILAACGGPDLWNRTRDAYFQKHTSNPFMKTVSCIVQNKLQDIVESADLDNWKDTLAILCTYATTDFARLCEMLAHRLENEKNDTTSATICLMFSGNLDNTIKIWLGSGDLTHDKNDLQEFIEKVIILQKVTGREGYMNDALASTYSEYADLLASQGLFELAVRYLNMLSEEQRSEKTRILLERVYYAQAQLPQGTPPPAFPFQRVEVGARRVAQPQPQPQPQQQQQQQQQHLRRHPQPHQQQQQQPTLVGYGGPATGYRQQPQHQQQQQQQQPPMVMPAGQPQPQPQQRQPQAAVVAPGVVGQQVPPPASRSMLGLPPAPMVGLDQQQLQQQQPLLTRPPPPPQQQLQQAMGTATSPVFGPMQPRTTTTLPPPAQQPQAAPAGGNVIPPFRPPPPPPATAAAAAAAAAASQPATLGPAVVPPPPPQQQQQGPSPAAAAPSRPAAAAPAATKQQQQGPVDLNTVDTASVPADQRVIVTVLLDTFTRCFAGHQSAADQKKKETIAATLAQLFDRLNKGEVSPQLANELVAFVECLARGDFAGADRVIVDMTQKHWSEAGTFLKNLKPLLLQAKSKQPQHHNHQPQGLATY